MILRLMNYILFGVILFLSGLLLYSVFMYEDFVHLLEKYLTSDNNLHQPSIVMFQIRTLFLYLIGILFLLKRYINGSKDILPDRIGLLQSIHYGLIILTVGLFFTFAFHSKIDDTIFREDGFFENFAVLLALISSSIFFYLGIYYKSIDKKIFFLIFAMLMFLYSMEEISWGQRILNLETPEAISKINYQNEINVHNIFINPYLGIIYYVFFLFISSLFLFRDKYIMLFSKSKITKIIAETYPSKQYFYVGFIYMFVAIGAGRIDDELSEELLTITIFIYSIDLLLKKFRIGSGSTNRQDRVD